MGFDEGSIVLNSDNGTYYPGQMLAGRLEFDLEKNKTFRGIYVEIKGKCKVHWTSERTRRVDDRTEYYTVDHDSHEEYMNLTIYLIGSKSGEQTLQPGRHVFPFECQIPPHCPSSFEASEGSIRYTVKVTVDRAFKLDQTKLATFRVEAPLDLNTIPDAKEPMAFEFEQTFCCWCMSAGLSQTIVKLPASGFIARQVIPIEVACNNNSSVEIDTIKFTLRKITRFEAQHEPDTRHIENVIAEIKKGPIPGNTTRNYTVEMTVPDMDVPNLITCRFISVEYSFKVEIGTSGCHEDEDETRRIYIGTIPLGSLQYPPNSDFGASNVNTYPPQPVINQPVSNSAPYPGGIQPYPGGNQYPGANPPYPGANPPYPGNTPTIGFTAENPPYPIPSPYPVGNDPPYPSDRPVVTAQHVNSAPYPTANVSPSYQPSNTPYPSNVTPNNTPYSSNVSPNNTPYPPSNFGPSSQPSNTPYPSSVGSNPSNSPYPVGGGLRTGNIGFMGAVSHEAMPLLPPGSLPPASSPFASASAPPPATPDDENKKPPYPV